MMRANCCKIVEDGAHELYRIGSQSVCVCDKDKCDFKLDTEFGNTNLCLLGESTIHLKKIEVLGCTVYSLDGDHDFQITDFNFGFYFARLDLLAQCILDTTDVHCKYVFDTIMFLENGESCLSTLATNGVDAGCGPGNSFGLLSYLEYFENKDLDSFDGASAGCGPGNLFGLLSYLEYFEMSGVTSLTVYSDTDVANVKSLDNG